MGPESTRSYRGRQVLTAPQRAAQEIDDGRRAKGYGFGAFRPASGQVLTDTYPRRTTINWVDFLTQVEAWIPADIERAYAIVDNLSTHRATDALLSSRLPPPGMPIVILLFGVSLVVLVLVAKRVSPL